MGNKSAKTMSFNEKPHFEDIAEVKKYLSNIYLFEQLAECKREQLEHNKNMSLAVNARPERLERWARLEKELDAEIDRFINAKESARKLIERVSEPGLRLLLELRYLNLKSWEEVGEIMSYSYRNIMYMHNRALEEILQSFSLSR